MDITVSPIVLTNVLFQVDVDNYAAHVSKVEFVPTVPTTSWKGLAPGSQFNASGNSTWVCNVDLAQDWTTPKSLARYLFAHEGEQKDVIFKPQNEDGAPAWAATVTIAPGNIGGTVDGVPVSSVTLQVKGKPVPDFDDDPLTPNPAE